MLRYEQSGVIAWRQRSDTDETIEVALVSSRSGKRWVIPKGLIDPGETALTTALREAEEEAGLTGTLSDEPIGHYRYEKWGGVCEVDVYLLAVEQEADTWLEDDFRERAWHSIEEAAALIDEPDLAALIRALPALVGDETQPDR